MADSDKNISIIPNRSLTGQPQIIFTGQGNDPITLKVLDSTIGSLSFEGSAGQLLSITDSLSSGSIFSVNDISGIPSIDVNADGTVTLAPYSGNVAVGVTSASYKLHVNGTFYANSAATFNGNIILSNGNIQTTTSTFNFVTNTASTINIGTTSGSSVNIASTAGSTTINNSAIVTGNMTVNGGTVTSTATTFNLLNTTVTNANVFGSADTVVIGSVNGTTTIRNAGTRVNGTLTVTGASTLQGAVNANSTLTVTGVTTLQGASTLQGAVNMNNTLTVTGVSVYQGAGHFNSTLSVTGASSLIGNVTASGDIAVNGGDITSTATTFNLLNSTVTNANVLGAANTILLGGTGGKTTIRNASTAVHGSFTVSGVASIFGGELGIGSTASSYASIYIPEQIYPNGFRIHDTANDSSSLAIGFYQDIGPFPSSGYMTIGNSYFGSYDVFPLDRPAWPGDPDIDANLTLNIGLGGTGAATNTGFSVIKTINIGGSTGTGNTTLINIGSATGTSNNLTVVHGNMTTTGSVVTRNLTVLGGTVTSTATTFNLLNTTVTNANVLGAANTIILGGTGGAATIRNAGTNINGTLTVTGGTALIGGISGNLSVQSNLLLNAATISSSSSTIANIFNSTVTSISIGGAANTVNIGSPLANINLGTGGLIDATVTVNGDLVQNGDSVSLFNGVVNGLFTSDKSGVYTVFTIASGDLFAIEPDPASLGLEFVFGGVSNTFIGDYSGQGNSTYIKVDDQNSTIYFSAPIGSNSGTVIASNDHFGVNAQKEIRFYDLDSSNYVGFKSPATVTANNIWILPAQDGAAGQLLTTDGADNLTWTTPPALDLFLFSQGII